jgi:hypothetical protein
MGRDEEPGELDKYNPDIPGLMELEDPGAGAALLEMPAPVPCTTKSCNKHLELPPS